MIQYLSPIEKCIICTVSAVSHDQGSCSRLQAMVLMLACQEEGNVSFSRDAKLQYGAMKNPIRLCLFSCVLLITKLALLSYCYLLLQCTNTTHADYRRLLDTGERPHNSQSRTKTRKKLTLLRLGVAEIKGKNKHVTAAVPLI